MRIKTMGKKVLAGILFVAMALTSAPLSTMETKAANYEYEDKIIYTNEVENAVTLYNRNEAPTKAGYVFGGWFEDGNGTTQVVSETASEGTNLYAKFVPAYVLSVKAQNHQDVKTTGNMRLVSSVDDDAHYKNVGFDVYFGNKDEEGYKKVAEGEKVYRRILVNKAEGQKAEYWAKDVFGEQAKYFSIAVITGIKDKSFASTIYVKPFWVTQDGTKVYGLGKYVCVQDGIDGIISIPVNLYTAKKIAVGTVKMTYPQELVYDGYRTANRLLNEMEVVPNSKNHTIGCAGNVANVDLGNLEANTDLYVSLRFKVADEYKNSVTVGKTRLNFTIQDTQFCTWEEEFVDLSDDVWNIQY